MAELEIATTSTSKIFEPTQNETIYYFRARTTNSYGTLSDWQEISAPINFYPVVINEIAWAGTEAYSQDEWIEFFNRTPFDINMSGWRLVSSDNKPNIVFSTSTKFSTFIYGDSFYLIERTNGSTTSEKEDWAGSFGSGLGQGLSNDLCEVLSLYDSQKNLVDQTNCLTNGNWPAGTASPDYLSMERVNPYLSADIPGNWQSNSTTTRNGSDAKGQPINGTPKAQNSVFNLEFFYLYPAKNTTATSTILEWTPSYINKFKDYKILRSFDVGFNPASTTIFAAATTTSFFDETLESETTYYYKISACDLSDYCVFSNVASTTTFQFPFFWAAPQLIFETATSSATSSDMVLDVLFDTFGQPQIIWISSSAAPNATSSDIKINVFNNQNQPYVFWIEKSGGQSAVYFKYQKTNGWTSDKKIFDLLYEINKFVIAIDSSNTAHLVFVVESPDPSSIPSQVYYASGIVE